MTVWSVKAVGTAARSTTDLTVFFNSPKGTKAKGGDFVGFALPYQWCGHHSGGMRTGAAGITASLSETSKTNVNTKVGSTISSGSGCNFFVELADKKVLKET